MIQGKIFSIIKSSSRKSEGKKNGRNIEKEDPELNNEESNKPKKNLKSSCVTQNVLQT